MRPPAGDARTGSDPELGERPVATRDEPRVEDVRPFPLREPAGPGESRAPYRRLKIGIALTDAIAVLAALLVAYYLRFHTGRVPEGYLGLVVFAPLVWVTVGTLYGLHTPWRLSAVEEFQRTISVAAIGTFFIIMASFWSRSSFSRVWVGLTFAFAVVFQLALRAAWRKDIRRLRARGHLILRTLIVGSEEEARAVVDELDPASSGFAPVGFVPIEGCDPPREGCLGGLDDIEAVISKARVDDVFVASSALTPAQMSRVIRSARRARATVHVAAALPELLSTRLTVQPVGRLTTLSVSTPRLSGAQAFTKRALDLVVGTIALVLALPLMAVTAVAVRLDSPGPVLFRQERVTKGGRTFRMLKFRTMHRDGDRILQERGIDPTAPFFKLGGDDPRITRVGRIIRKFSIDELPQLFNVLKGEMSLVGPRPLPLDQVEANLDLLGPRHEVPSGVTGWWQIKGRSDATPEEAVYMDDFYIENWSPALDIFILFRTLGAVIRRRGAV